MRASKELVHALLTNVYLENAQIRVNRFHFVVKWRAVRCGLFI